MDGQGLIVMLDAAGSTIASLRQQIEQLQAENAALKQALQQHDEKADKK